ncbi:acyltransferase family protein [Paludibaculum fermentans]|uniref:Acyltransferase n=1 Tax=Paludibaculum fermentans TaxID=1473598 RepID=A0A7S7SQL6_PALFE|nr:acyltransferase [Paludibaculum fermentans]QOY92335.1 acyltransferase [Paludibaculum fermentans]
MAPKERPIYRGNIRELDGLRGIAIFIVLVHHFWPGGDSPLGRFGEIAHLGWMGVDLFFVISGFLICGILLDTAQDPHYYRNFYARRSLRIFPPYYILLIFAFTLVPAAQVGVSYFDTDFIRASGNPLWYFLYAGNIREALTNQSAYILAPLWSLAIEEQFYISFPFLVASLRRENLWKALCALVIFAPLFRILSVWLMPSLTRMPYVATLARIDVISIGCLLAVAFRTGRIRTNARWPLILALVLLAATAACFQLGWLDRRTVECKTLGYSLTAFLFGAIVLATILSNGSRGTAFLRWGPLTYLGKICYGTYLLHLPAEVVLTKALEWAGFDTLSDPPWFMPLKIVTAIVAASLSWWLFESRILRLKDRFTSRSHPQQATEAAIAP